MTAIPTDSVVVIEFDFEDNEDALADPDSISASISAKKDTTGYPVTITLTRLSVGKYSYDWTASEAGSFTFYVTGYFDNDADVVHLKKFLIGSEEPGATLDGPLTITLLSKLEPIYIDPEFILQYSPASDLTEVTEIIWRKSLELEHKLGQTNLIELTSNQHDFIVAAVMCELSRIYGLVNGGLTGFNGIEDFELGDLKVSTNRSSGFASGAYDAGNAGTWCELAAILKDQLSSVNETFRSVVPGASYAAVIPDRGLKYSG
jgi:hypothetical protein